MQYKYNKSLVKNAQQLRRNMTPEEKHLWYDFLKKLPMTANRQKNIRNYIVDFYIAKEKIVIEIDGEQHGKEENRESDKKRDDKLRSLGITVLRYTNKEVNKHFEDVCKDILKHLGMTVSEYLEGQLS